MALVNPCLPANAAVNTGSECDDAMGYSRQMWLMPATLKWTATDELNFDSYLDTQRHAPAATRVYPIFGIAVPVRSITDANEADVLEIFEDGSKNLVRRGMYSRTFLTDKGGLCLAQHLMRINRSLAFIEVDADNQVNRQINSDGTRSGFPVNLVYSPSPDLANLKTVFHNKLMLDFNPLDYIGKGGIVKGDATEDILSIIGLLDVTLYEAAAKVSSGATAATGGFTIVLGATNDTIDTKVSGVSISGGPVIQTASETTATLLAAKVKTAINAATATNGGYTANNAAGVLTITGPLGLGATINTIQATATIVGTITTTTPVAFAGGVTGTTILKLGIKTSCSETDLIAKYGVTLVTIANFAITNAAGTAIVISLASIVAGIANLTIPYINGTYSGNLAAAATLKAAGVVGYEGVTPAAITIT